MSSQSGIEWTDSTWNPVRGCTKISTGCKNCYAETFAERWRGVAGHPYEQGFDVRLVPEALTLPLKWRKPRRIFVNSMSDLFHEAVPEYYIAQVFAVMSMAERHTFQVLTKRAFRMRELSASNIFYQLVRHIIRSNNSLHDWHYPEDVCWPLRNVWLGVSCENQKYADDRINLLCDTTAAVRFISAEPLLGPISLQLDKFMYTRAELLHWVIVGGESGPGARPMDPQWVRSIRDQCEDAHVPFFFKQWGGSRKKLAGRLLDGKEHNAFPLVAENPPSKT